MVEEMRVTAIPEKQCFGLVEKKRKKKEKM